MIYLRSINFPNANKEADFTWRISHTCYDSFYPFKVLSAKGLERLDFEPVTILYGGNGSGKSTALNVIAEKQQIKRDAIFNKSPFYADYVEMCKIETESEIPENSRIITSDDVFDYLLNLRSLNDGIDLRREEVFFDYLNRTVPEWGKKAHLQMKSLEDYDEIKKMVNARRKTQSRYTRDNLMDNARTFSNGESAFMYFTEKIGEKGLYILDEPENSLSPKLQMELARFIEDSARFFECQIIMSTHSPFLLALKGAKIYDLDKNPTTVKPWTELEHIRLYHEFFKENAGEF